MLITRAKSFFTKPMKSFREGRNLVILSLNDGEHKALKLFFFIHVYMKQTSLICQNLINNPEFPYEELRERFYRPGDA